MYIAPNKKGILDELSIVAGAIRESLDRIQAPKDDHRHLTCHQTLICSFGGLGPQIILNEISQLKAYIINNTNDDSFSQGNSPGTLVSAWADWLVSGQSPPEIAQSAGRFTRSVMGVLDITSVDLDMLAPLKPEPERPIPHLQG